jgi:hypothetical protein
MPFTLMNCRYSCRDPFRPSCHSPGSEPTVGGWAYTTVLRTRPPDVDVAGHRGLVSFVTAAPVGLAAQHSELMFAQAGLYGSPT